ncbi:MAG: 16S rRNA (cytidine(1402)-2'-O)-methyltransferase, partial [Chthoniobacterales bacterium]
MLFVVPTPIGNLDDITLRAIRVLGEVDLIAAEDTRHSGMLLKHLGISKPMISFHQHNEASRTCELIEKLTAGQSIAVITDAGTPGISDPGARLIRACIQAGIAYTVLPGACAVVLAIVGSGLGCGGFFFGGFLPVKSGQREREITLAIQRDEPTVFYESPYRLVKSLRVLERISPEHNVCVARELSKKFEEFRHGWPTYL